MTIHSPAHQGDAGIPERSEPPYATSLHAFLLATRPVISEGWVEHFNQMMRSLWAINNPSRAFLCFQGAQVEVGHFSVRTSQFDPVVAGVTRKAGQRMASTCQVCGHAGKQRVLGLRTLTLCPRCYAKDALRADLRNFFYDLKSKAFLAKGVYVETDIPPRVAICLQGDSWRTLVDTDSTGEVRCITLHEIERQLPRLQSLKDLVDKERITNQSDWTTANEWEVC